MRQCKSGLVALKCERRRTVTAAKGNLGRPGKPLIFLQFNAPKRDTKSKGGDRHTAGKDKVMTKYEITAVRENGSELKDIVYAANEKTARRDFNEIYRHADKLKITSIVALGEGYQASKDQEREALEEIRRIVSTLGEGSYISIALTGCLEDAEENINNDFALSMNGRWQYAEQEVEKAKARISELEAQLEEARNTTEKQDETIEDYETRIAELQENMLSEDDITDCVSLVREKLHVIEQDIKEQEQLIVQHAHTPNCEEFKQAVRYHRTSTSTRDYYKQLEHNLNHKN